MLLIAPRVPAVRMGVINDSIDKENPKRVDIITVTDLLEDKCRSRPWASARRPSCAAAGRAARSHCATPHVKHNKETGDNVGPLIIDNDTK